MKIERTTATATDSRYYKNALIADIARLAGLNDDLTCDIWHPGNAIYRAPSRIRMTRVRPTRWPRSSWVRSPQTTPTILISMATRPGLKP